MDRHKNKSSEPKLNIRTPLAKDFADRAKKLKLNQSQLFSQVWESYQLSERLSSSPIELSEEERKQVERVIEVRGVSFEELLKISLLKVVGEILQSDIQIPEPPQDLPAAERRIWLKLNEIIHWNSYCKPEDRAYLSISCVRRYHTAEYGKIKVVLAMRQEEIERHHKAFNIREDANLKGMDPVTGKRIDVVKLIGSYPPPNSQPVVREQPTIEVIAEPEPIEEETVEGVLSPKQYFEALKDEVNPSKHQKLSDKLLAELRSRLDVRVLVNAQGQLTNEGAGSPVDLDKELEKYRRLFRSHPLSSATMSYRQLKNPRLPSSYSGGNPPEGSRFNDEGLVVAEPRHLAISYLGLSDIENAYMNLTRGEQYAQQYPQYSLA